MLACLKINCESRIKMCVNVIELSLFLFEWKWWNIEKKCSHVRQMLLSQSEPKRCNIDTGKMLTSIKDQWTFYLVFAHSCSGGTLWDHAQWKRILFLTNDTAKLTFKPIMWYESSTRSCHWEIRLLLLTKKGAAFGGNEFPYNAPTLESNDRWNRRRISWLCCGVWLVRSGIDMERMTRRWTRCTFLEMKY